MLWVQGPTGARSPKSPLPGHSVWGGSHCRRHPLGRAASGLAHCWVAPGSRGAFAPRQALPTGCLPPGQLLPAPACPILVPRSCSGRPGASAPGRPLSPRGSVWREAETGEAKCEKTEALFQTTKAPQESRASPSPAWPSTGKSWTPCASLATELPERWRCHSHHPKAPVWVPRHGDNQQQGPQQRQERTRCASVASYPIACNVSPENTVRTLLPAGRAVRPSRLWSLELGLGGGRVPADVEQQEEAEAEGGRGAHGQGLPQHQQRVEGTWARSRAWAPRSLPEHPPPRLAPRPRAGRRAPARSHRS